MLERPANNDLGLASWYEGARTSTDNNYRKDAYLTVYDSEGKPTLKIYLENAWPAEYHLEQQGGQMVERVRLTADFFQRVAP